MFRRFAIFLLFFGSSVLLWAKLPKNELNRRLRNYNQAVQEGDPYTIARAIEQLAEDNSKRMVKFLLKCALKFSEPEIHKACRRALQKISDPKAKKYLLQVLQKGPKWELQVFLMEALKQVPGKEVTKAICANLKSKRAPVVMMALQVLGQRRDRKAVLPLIEFLERWEKGKRRGEVHYQARKALSLITGYNYETAEDWRKWWEAGGSQGKVGGSYGRTVQRGMPKRTGPRFFTEEVVSDRVVFVIDVSASMEEKDPPRGEWGKTGVRPQPVDPAKLPDSRMRIERAKQQLIQVIKKLPSHTRFNIIAFNHRVKAWSSRLRQATSSQKASAIQFVLQFRPEGKTATYSALEAAFRDKSVDTIYLLSDGTPTVGPSPGRILQQVYQWNRFRKVRIFTLGFPGVNREFMMRLAQENRGKYSDIR